MSFPRSSGVLLHPTSLPGPYGIGELGPEAHAFADFLRDAGQRIWQVLPLGPTGYGDSPYQCFSAFAGNPLLISVETLAQRELPERARSGRAAAISRRRCGFRRGHRMEAAAAAPRLRHLSTRRRQRGAPGLRRFLPPPCVLAGRFRAVHGAEGFAQQHHVDALGARTRHARAGGAGPGPRTTARRHRVRQVHPV